MFPVLLCSDSWCQSYYAKTKLYPVIQASLMDDLLHTAGFHMMITWAHRTVMGDLLGVGILLVVVELAVGAVDVDMAMRLAMPICLHGSDFRFPTKMLRILRVEFAIELCVMPFVLGRGVDILLIGFREWRCEVGRVRQCYLSGSQVTISGRCTFPDLALLEARIGDFATTEVIILVRRTACEKEKREEWGARLVLW